MVSTSGFSTDFWQLKQMVNVLSISTNISLPQLCVMVWLRSWVRIRTQSLSDLRRLGSVSASSSNASMNACRTNSGNSGQRLITFVCMPRTGRFCCLPGSKMKIGFSPYTCRSIASLRQGMSATRLPSNGWLLNSSMNSTTLSEK